MNKLKFAEDLSVVEAVDNLSTMAELDLVSVEREKELIQKGLEGELEGIRWLSLHNADKKRDLVKQTFRVLFLYLEQLWTKNKEQLQDIATQRGIQAMMLLVGEAAQKMDRYTNLFKEVQSLGTITNLKEYQELQQFYLTKVVKKFQPSLQEEEPWESKVAVDQTAPADLSKPALREVEIVRRDSEYELFLIRGEEGRAFFTPQLLRHVRMVGECEEMVKGDENPFPKVRALDVELAQVRARKILDLSANQIEAFYKVAMLHKDREYVAFLNKALMALMLAANSSNARGERPGKSSLNYLRDFHFFLRLALQCREYQKHLVKEGQDDFGHVLISLSHVLCLSFFTHSLSLDQAKQELKKLLQISYEGKPLNVGREFWSSLADNDQHLRAYLKRFANGPLLKALVQLRQEGKGTGFDPLAQSNFPMQLFALTGSEIDVSVLHLPSPTKQEWIHRAEIVDEFKAFLRALSSKYTKRRHLLINHQDRSSWREAARSLAIENETAKTEALCVLTLPKDSDFYHQRGRYHDLNSAEEFIREFQAQIEKGEEAGFCLPKELSTKAMSEWSLKLMQTLHEHFFSARNVLPRQSRLDFIELFMQLYILKALERLKIDSMSFSCKDGIDTGAAAAAGFFAFLSMIRGDFGDEEADDFVWLLYGPAMVNRERAIDSWRFHRVVNFLSLVDRERKEGLAKALGALYETPYFSEVKLKSS
jgi:hypothetical protein